MKNLTLPRITIITSLIIFIFAISGLYFLQSRINNLRSGPDSSILHLDPSETIPIILLGSFRGIVVDFLWVRGIARHDERKYYDLLAINNLIAKLQPHFPVVWIFQAWNMSYNIAHEWDQPENKWRWINAGIEYAKKGASKNPKSGDLLFEIGNMYFHKFNSRLFKHAGYYKAQLLEETGKNSYEHALYWVRKSLDYGSNIRSKLVMERTICYILWQASLQEEKDGRLDEAFEYATRSANEWKLYLNVHPDDPDGKAEKALKLINEKLLQLEQLLERNKQ